MELLSNPSTKVQFFVFTLSMHSSNFVFLQQNQTIIHMKRLIFGLCSLFFLSSCGENVEKLAALRLDSARQYFEKGDYNEAKIQIDSIKILYPKAYETRQQGIYLMQDIELEEQQKSVHFLDSMLLIRKDELAQMVGKFTFEKDEAYEQLGNYLWPTQVIEKNIHQTYLRFQVNERGEMKMTSVYCGAPIHHTTIKVTAPDGTFAETPAAADCYETKDLGKTLEYGDYKLGADGGVISFVALNKDKNLKVEFKGDRKHTVRMRPSDRVAAASLYELHSVLAAVESLKKEKEEAEMKIRFVTKKIEERALKQQQED